MTDKNDISAKMSWKNNTITIEYNDGNRETLSIKKQGTMSNDVVSLICKYKKDSF